MDRVWFEVAIEFVTIGMVVYLMRYLRNGGGVPSKTEKSKISCPQDAEEIDRIVQDAVDRAEDRFRKRLERHLSKAVEEKRPPEINEKAPQMTDGIPEYLQALLDANNRLHNGR